MRFISDSRPLPVATGAGPGARQAKQVAHEASSLIGAAVLVLAGSVEARTLARDGCAERCAVYVQLGPSDDDDEMMRPGPRGDDGEPLEMVPPGPPGPPSDYDEEGE